MISPSHSGARLLKGSRVLLCAAALGICGIAMAEAQPPLPVIDPVKELAAIKAVFGTNNGVAVSSTKSATGHLLGAAGGLEAIYSVLAVRDQIAPATLNLDNPDDAAEGVDLIRGAARPMKIEHVLSNGFGFGGVNASVLFKAWHA